MTKVICDLLYHFWLRIFDRIRVRILIHAVRTVRDCVKEKKTLFYFVKRKEGVFRCVGGVSMF